MGRTKDEEADCEDRYNSVVISTVASNYVAVAQMPEGLLTSTLAYTLNRSIIAAPKKIEGED